MNALVLLLASITIALPCAAVLWLWTGKNSNKVEWQVKASIAAAISIFAFTAGTWALASYYLRYALPPAFLAAAYLSYRKIKYRPIFVRMHEKGRIGFSIQVVSLIAILAIDIFTIKGLFYPGDPIDLAFPLKNGSYYVLQGGSSPFTNPFHRKDPAELYAIDIVKLNSTGNRAWGLFPSAPSRYAINGATVFSPCAGKVAESAGGLPDNRPGSVDRYNPAGNYIVIDCDGTNVWLAHLLSDSLLVKRGDTVRQGQPLAQVGNSGNSMEPHLHIHAVRSDAGGKKSEEAMPMVFEGRFLTLNSVYRAK